MICVTVAKVVLPGPVLLEVVEVTDTTGASGVVCVDGEVVGLGDGLVVVSRVVSTICVVCSFEGVGVVTTDEDVGVGGGVLVDNSVLELGTVLEELGVVFGVTVACASPVWCCLLGR